MKELSRSPFEQDLSTLYPNSGKESSTFNNEFDDDSSDDLSDCLKQLEKLSWESDDEDFKTSHLILSKNSPVYKPGPLSTSTQSSSP